MLHWPVLRNLILAVCSVLIGSATTLTGSLKNPDGTGANGYLYLNLAQQAALQSGGCGGPAEIVPQVRTRIQIINGVMQSPPSIYGNDCMLPLNTFYEVRFTDNNGNLIFTDRWQISGSSIDIGTIVSIVISGTTQTLGSTGVIIATPQGAQTITQPGVTDLSVNNFAVTTKLVAPGGMQCTAAGCQFGSGVFFPNGLVAEGNSTIQVGAGGNFYGHTFTGGDASCGGIDNGWQAMRVDQPTMEVCLGGVTYAVGLIQAAQTPLSAVVVVRNQDNTGSCSVTFVRGIAVGNTCP